jgi:hypothetical protein
LPTFTITIVFAACTVGVLTSLLLAELLEAGAASKLCGTFGRAGTAAVIEAVGGRSGSAVSYGPDSVFKLADRVRLAWTRPSAESLTLSDHQARIGLTGRP